MSDTLGTQVAEAMGTARQIDRFLQQAEKSNPEDVSARIAALRKRFSERSPDLLSAVGQVYSDVYTQDELNAIICFLQSPAGWALASKQAEVEQRVQAVAQDFLKTL